MASVQVPTRKYDGTTYSATTEGTGHEVHQRGPSGGKFCPSYVKHETMGKNALSDFNIPVSRFHLRGPRPTNCGSHMTTSSAISICGRNGNMQMLRKVICMTKMKKTMK